VTARPTNYPILSKTNYNQWALFMWAVGDG
jgi:hypothetical protein